MTDWSEHRRGLRPLRRHLTDKIRAKDKRTSAFTGLLGLPTLRRVDGGLPSCALVEAKMRTFAYSLILTGLLGVTNAAVARDPATDSAADATNTIPTTDVTATSAVSTDPVPTA